MGILPARFLRRRAWLPIFSSIESRFSTAIKRPGDLPDLFKS
jgi:hypothetical protein